MNNKCLAASPCPYKLSYAWLTTSITGTGVCRYLCLYEPRLQCCRPLNGDQASLQEIVLLTGFSLRIEFLKRSQQRQLCNRIQLSDCVSTHTVTHRRLVTYLHSDANSDKRIFVWASGIHSISNNLSDSSCQNTP